MGARCLNQDGFSCPHNRDLMFGPGRCGSNIPSSQELLLSMLVHSEDSGWSRETGISWNFSTRHFLLYLKGASRASGGLIKGPWSLGGTAQHVLCPLHPKEQIALLLERLLSEGEGMGSGLRTSLDFSVGIVSPGLHP